MNLKLIIEVGKILFDEEHRKKIIYIIIGIMLLIFLPILAIFGGATSSDQSPFGKANVPPYIEKWRPLVSVYTNKYGVSQYTDFLLALIYQEIGSSSTNDIMQSSESEGLPPNSIQNPEESVDAGVKYFKSVLDYGNSKHVDFTAIVQAYNFGWGYIDFVSSNGGKSTDALAQTYSSMEASKMGWQSYGDVSYASKVMKNLAQDEVITAVNSSPLGIDNYNKLMSIAQQYQGMPYVFGGASPVTSFDCSGLTEYVYNQIGIKLNRTAQEQYEQCAKVSQSDAQPGDLVFFQGTYVTSDYITHVGIYTGNNKFYQAGGKGIGYADLTGYFQQHLVGFGRVPNK